MNTKKTEVVIVTTTFYKGVEELRFKLACSLVTKAVTAGHTVVVVDGSPIPEIAIKLRELGALVFPELHRGMGPSRRQAFFHAYEVALENGAGIIVWTEPEKDDLIRSVPNIVQELGQPYCSRNEIVVLGRSATSWSTWPSFQAESEQRANQVFNKHFGVEDFDPFFGPVAFNLRVARYFVVGDYYNVSGVPDTYIQHYAPMVARVDGVKVVTLEVDIVYSPEQRAEEECALNEFMKLKRQTQFETLTSAYYHLSQFLRPCYNP